MMRLSVHWLNDSLLDALEYIMPKKPFTPAEVELQQNRIMDGAARVMAETGYHQLSMRTLASRLEMTASNIYNYFPGKESLLLNIRRRGFELAFRQIFTFSVGQSGDVRTVLVFLKQLVCFGQAYPGYYALMFQPPQMTLDESPELEALNQQLNRLIGDWQQQIQHMLTTVIPTLDDCGSLYRQRVTLFFMASVHGLISGYHHNAFPGVIEDQLSEDFLHDFVGRLVAAIGLQTPDIKALPLRQNA